ncbi:MlaD family protein [Nocardia aurantiaca]|uniref:Mammalian cell entry protein n=1 Tax=Nocardia aurantiaca TaxID=2675850 RepID=A0A6I3L6Y7_9NOCA|nr:mammalian cell entry protein [Nocardia aurantiaca]MTE16720.1 mammalian cell entry protein [Nocardia aurantiaca]
MPNYTIPGISTSRRRVLAIGSAVAAVIVGVGLTWVGWPRDDGHMRVELLTEQIGDGIVVGSGVRIDGVVVGTVDNISDAGSGRQRITLAFNDSGIPGLTDQLAVDYVPSNLFGISELELSRGQGGTPVHGGSVVDLTRTHANRVHDATMGALLRSLSDVLPNVMTPHLTQLLTQVAADVTAFAPILEALITTTRLAAETQRLVPSELVGNYAQGLSGFPSLLSGSVVQLSSFGHIEVLRNDREWFDNGVDLVASQLFPAIGATGAVANRYLGPYTDMLAPLFTALAHTVPDPQRSSAELRQLLDSIGGAFQQSPDGPVLNLDVTLRGMPGLAQPLLGAVSGAPGGGR